MAKKLTKPTTKQIMAALGKVRMLRIKAKNHTPVDARYSDVTSYLFAAEENILRAADLAMRFE